MGEENHINKISNDEFLISNSVPQGGTILTLGIGHLLEISHLTLDIWFAKIMNFKLYYKRVNSILRE